jgi:hypothetical protein
MKSIDTNIEPLGDSESISLQIMKKPKDLELKRKFLFDDRNLYMIWFNKMMLDDHFRLLK